MLKLKSNPCAFLAGLAGGRYRLCWCSADGLLPMNGSAHCDIISNFRLDIGELQVLGPELSQDRTCISGHTCFVKGIKGEALSDLDSVLVLETCGIAEIVPRFAGMGLVTNVTRGGASLSWGVRNTAAGGTYRLCWCSGFFTCRTPQHFRVDFGSLLMLGVAPLEQSATCVAGRSCLLNSLTSTGEVLILDTCGLGASAPSTLTLDANWTDFQILAPSAVGRWRLCWCDLENTGNASSCATSLEFAVDFGHLTVLGPMSQGHTCASGLPCVAEGLLGIGLGIGDTFAVLETCGTVSPVTGFPNSGLGVFDASSGILHWDVGNTWNTSTSMTAAGGEYRLCWCSSHGSCNSFTDFRYDAGALSVLGPAPFQHRTCISGQSCQVHGLRGHLLNDEPLMILDTCGITGIVAGFPETGLLTVNSSLPTVPTAASGGLYRICWCIPPSEAFQSGVPNYAWAAQSGCALPEDFRVDVGSLSLLGPLHGQARTCLSGTICNIENLLGLGLSFDNRLQLLDTCQQRVSPAIEFQQVNGSIARWFGDAAIPGGAYRLCWCAAGSCEGVVDIGSFSLVGVAAFQDRTCVAGQPCKIAGVDGHGSLSGSYISVLETCGVASAGVAFPQSDVISLNEEPFENATNLSSSSTGIIRATSWSWTLALLTVRGGSYRLCWCAPDSEMNATEANASIPGCNGPGDFRVDFGELMVIGPAAATDVTCVSGQECLVDSLDGQFLSQSDSMILLETCGSPASHQAGLPQHGLASTVYSSGSTAYWGLSPLSAAGGVYRLCWCGAGFSCSSAEDFVMEVGAFTLRGPRLSQDRTCVSGLGCNLASDLSPFLVQGVVAVRVALLPAQASSLTSLEISHARLPDMNVTQLAASCSTFDVEPAGLGLNWYSCTWAPVTASYWLISLFSTSLQVHEIQLQGLEGWVRPKLEQAAGDDHKLVDGDLSTFMVSSDSPQIVQMVAFEPDSLIVAGHCFLDPSKGSASEWAWGPVAAGEANILLLQGGQYRLCWCSRGFRCTLADDFIVDVGQLTVVGPVISQSTCISGRPCAVELQGQHLSHEDEVLVLHTCGVSDAMAWKLSDLGPLQQLSESGTAAISEGIVTASGGAYRLCWCGASSRSCAETTDFIVDAGELWLMGVAPLLQSRTCVSGQTCWLDGPSGLGLSSTDLVLVLETCGTTSVPARMPMLQALQGEFNSSVNSSSVAFSAVALDSSLNSNLTWVAEITAAGGQYRLCWCAAGCDLSTDFQVDFGGLMLLGPSPLKQSWTCISGQVCRLAGKTGLGLGSAEEITVLDTCGSGSGWHHAPAVSLDSDWELRLTSAGGLYRLCWCAKSMYPCATADEFRVDFGDLLVLGPAPLMQDRTCVSGKPCKVTGLSGVGLSRNDLLMVWDTCATMAAPYRMPFAGSLLSIGLRGGGFLSAEAGSNGTTLAFLSAAGGQYRLCWSASIEPFQSNDTNMTELPAERFWGTCNDTIGGNRFCAAVGEEGHFWIAQHALVDIGRLTILGPSLQHSRTCVSGQICKLDGLGGMLLDAHDQVAVLDTCGAHGEVFTESLQARAWASSAEFAVLSLAGGAYRLCWCSHVEDCLTAAEFRIDFGSLTMIGPRHGQDARVGIGHETCVNQ